MPLVLPASCSYLQAVCTFAHALGEYEIGRPTGITGREKNDASTT